MPVENLKSAYYDDENEDEEYDEAEEDEELLALANARIASYGGWEEAMKHAIPHDEFWERLGVTGDLDDVEGYEIA